MKWEYVAMGILFAWALSASILALTYYSQYSYFYNKYTSETIVVDIGINYGNGTLIWYNSTRIISGMSVYEALLLVADEVNATYGVYGVYVTEINGVAETANVSWMYAINRNDSTVLAWYGVNDWYYPGVSADKLTLKDGDKVVWIYVNWVKYFPPPDPTTRENVRS